MKKFLISLFVGFVGLISFGYCEDVIGLADVYTIESTYMQQGTFVPLIQFDPDVGQKVVCVSLTNFNNSNVLIGFEEASDRTPGEPYRVWRDWDGKYSCLVKGANTPYLLVKPNSYSERIEGTYFYLNDLLNTELPVLSSSDCQSLYDLIPISSIDTNYCVENDLCPVCTGAWSELKINNIVHEGRPLINLSIPDYISRDYTVDDNQYDIYVGSGYDQDYIDSVLAINSYRPDSEDFTQMFVSGLTLIFPYIFVALLIVFMWKLLKRVFK